MRMFSHLGKASSLIIILVRIKRKGGCERGKDTHASTHLEDYSFLVSACRVHTGSCPEDSSDAS